MFRRSRQPQPYQGALLHTALLMRRRNKYVLYAAYSLFVATILVAIMTLTMFEQPVVRPAVMLQAASSTPGELLTLGSQPLFSQPDFFTQTLHTFVETQQTFIEADLAAMVIRYYRAGEQVFSAPILSKGREGSWWETPAGLYEIELKRDNHLSSFGGVYQPWSMVFQGNFFIHGWPYYPDGKPVASTYSGGCIRLDTADAKKLYDLVDVATPVLVHEADFTPDQFSYELTPPTLSAAAHLVVDLQNGTILAAEQADQTFPVGTLATLMTALVAAEYINLDTSVYISERVAASSSVLTAESTVNAYSLMYPLLQAGDAGAAVAYAEQRASDRFVSYMNEKAAALGMKHTKYTEPIGGDTDAVTTAEDTMLLMRYLLHNRSFILNISAGAFTNSAYARQQFSDLENQNILSSLTEQQVGGVVSSTDNQGDAAVILRAPVRGEERQLAFIVFASADPKRDITALYEYTVDRFFAEVDTALLLTR